MRNEAWRPVPKLRAPCVTSRRDFPRRLQRTGTSTVGLVGVLELPHGRHERAPVWQLTRRCEPEPTYARFQPPPSARRYSVSRDDWVPKDQGEPCPNDEAVRRRLTRSDTELERIRPKFGGMPEAWTPSTVVSLPASPLQATVEEDRGVCIDYQVSPSDLAFDSICAFRCCPWRYRRPAKSYGPPPSVDRQQDERIALLSLRLYGPRVH